MTNKIQLIACASGLGGADIHSGDGPLKIHNSPYFKELIQHAKYLNWHTLLEASASPATKEARIAEVMTRLSQVVYKVAKSGEKFIVLGGDHTSAIGTWSGVYQAFQPGGEIGLIWIDAHMDSHTPQTSLSQNIHGMPLACLLGHGDKRLTSIGGLSPKLQPENVCLISVRSYEPGEAELLNKLNVKVYYMPEVKQRGYHTVLQEAIDRVSRHTVRFGISFDLDSLDPAEAPGVDVPEPDGLHLMDVKNAWHLFFAHDKFCGLEIVEFDPLRDVNEKTEKLFINLLAEADTFS